MVAVGDIVHFWQAGDSINVPCAVGKPLAGIVCDVEPGSGKANLTVFDRRGQCWPVIGVPLRTKEEIVAARELPFFATPR